MKCIKIKLKETYKKLAFENLKKNVIKSNDFF